MGGDFMTIRKPGIGKKPFVAADQHCGHKRGLKAHVPRLYRD